MRSSQQPCLLVGNHRHCSPLVSFGMVAKQPVPSFIPKSDSTSPVYMRYIRLPDPTFDLEPHST
jgi:hypothetical protein